MMNAVAGSDPESLETFVIGNPVGEGRIEKCQMVEPGAAFRLINQSRNGDQRNAMMLVVVGQERDEIVLVQDFSAERGLVPFNHFLEPRSPEHRVREPCRRDSRAFTIRGFV